MDNFNNLYIPVRERIFTQLASKAISQRDFAKAIHVSPQTITAWKMGENFSFMKKLTPIAEALGTSEVWLLTGKDEAQADGIVQLLRKEAHPMNAKFEIDPTLLDDAVEVMRFAVDCCEADAAALARLIPRRPGSWPRRGSKWRRRRTGSCSSSPSNEKRPVQRANAGQGRNLKPSRKRSYGRILHHSGPECKWTCLKT